MTSSRRTGWEWRLLSWLARHPGTLLVPGILAAGIHRLGVLPVALIVGGLVAALWCWYRAHPPSFDTLIRPRLRAWRRRWFSHYTGHLWRDVATACDLASTHRTNGTVLTPRILRVQSPTPSIDLLRVRLPPGQSTRTWEQKLPELADSLRVERVAVERLRPQVISLIIQRTEPFTDPVQLPPIPQEIDQVDLHNVWLGIDEYGQDWCEPVIAQHWFCAGASGSGKSSLLHGPAYQLAPLVKAGLVRFWDVDPKKMELSTTRRIAHRYACEPDDMLDLLDEYTADQERAQRQLAAAGLRKAPVSVEYPLNILRLDELGALTAFGEHGRIWRNRLSIIGTQGRASGHLMWAYVQEPSKDIVPIRDAFTRRMCLRVTASAHVDMSLGEDARLRGALADAIPNDPSTAGIGYVIRQRSRLPLRVRAGHTTDAHLITMIAAITGSDPTTVALSRPDDTPPALAA